MSSLHLRSVVPEVYRPMLPAFFDQDVPDEEKATCSSCAMCAPAGAPPQAEVHYFRPDAKCCTYHPLLPNYLVGAILADDRPDMQEGKRRIRERIAHRLGVSPQWIAPSRKVDLLMRAARKEAFGRSLALLCPYFERTQQNCTIWRHRESVCTTFYCKYNAGADGEIFWRALRRYLAQVEVDLAVAGAKRLLPGHQEPRPLAGDMSLEELEDRGPPEHKYRALWGSYAGREEEFYLSCFEWARSLGPDSFREIVAGGPHDERLREVTDALEAAVRPKLPARLRVNPEMTRAETDAGVLVCSYSRYEPLMLTKELFELLGLFGAGADVAEVREKVEREHGVEVPEDLLVGLYQFRVLVPPA